MSIADNESQNCRDGGAPRNEAQDCSGQPRAVLTSEPYPLLSDDEVQAGETFVSFGPNPWPDIAESVRAKAMSMEALSRAKVFGDYDVYVRPEVVRVNAFGLVSLARTKQFGNVPYTVEAELVRAKAMSLSSLSREKKFENVPYDVGAEVVRAKAFGLTGLTRHAT